MKKKHLIFIIPIVVAIAFWVYFQFNQSKAIDGFKLVPKNAYYVIETDKPVSSWTTFSETAIWHTLKQHPVMADLTDDADYLDQLIRDNGKVFSWFDDATLLISAHPTSTRDYDFLFVVGVSKKAKKSVLLPGLKQVLKSLDYITSDSEIDGERVLKATDNSNETLYFAHINNQLICSFSKAILTLSIQTASQNNALNDQQSFKSTYTSVATQGLCRLYLPYQRIENLLKCYFDTGVSDVTNVTNQLVSSSFDFAATSDYWQLDGLTAIDSSHSSYIKAFTQSGESSSEVGRVLSNRTAWSVSFNFKSFDHFKGNLESYLKETPDYAHYQKQTKQLEALLDISVKRDLTDWIGDEITIAQLRKNLQYNKKENAVILIKTKDLELAKDRLNFVAEKVKKRTPALFKQIDYRNYHIQYLEIKGLFKLFFGKSFEKITKPYYTIIDNYVVFSNSPYTLIGLIEDFENQRCLQESLTYQNFKAQGQKSSVHLYVSPNNLYPVMVPMLDAESAATIKQSKAYFEAFESFGLRLTSNGDGFKTQATLIKTQSTETVETVKEDEFKKLYQLYASERDITSSNFVVEWIEDGVYKKQYPGSDKLQIVADTKRGVLHGSYTEYYENGEKRLTGKYKMGRKKGTWKSYDSNGQFIEKKKY